MTPTPAISPCFIVSDVPTSVAFYRDHLSFTVTLLTPPEAPFFAILVRDGAQLFLKSEAGITPRPNHTRHHHLRWDAFLYTPDPDALAAEFAATQTPFHSPLQDTHDNLRGFELRDPDNYTLFFGRPR